MEKVIATKREENCLKFKKIIEGGITTLLSYKHVWKTAYHNLNSRTPAFATL